MRKTIYNFFILLFLLPLISFSQKSYIKGVVLDINNNPIENVTISSTYNNNKTGVTTNENGFYSIEIDALKDVNVVYSHLSYKKISFTIN